MIKKQFHFVLVLAILAWFESDESNQIKVFLHYVTLDIPFLKKIAQN